MTVTKNSPFSTADLNLSDGVTNLEIRLCDGQGNPTPLAITEQPNPRSAVRVAQGAGGYSDFELPFTPISQSDWSGGRGAKEFEADASRYADGYKIDTSRPGMILPAGKVVAGTGYEVGAATGPRTGAYVGGEAWVVASAYTPATTFKVTKLSVWVTLRAGGNPLEYIIRNDNSDSPGATIIDAGMTYVDWVDDEEMEITFYPNVTLTGGTKYWLTFFADGAEIDFAYANNAAKKIMVDKATGSWELGIDDKELLYEINDAGQGVWLPFLFSKQLWAISSPDNGGAARLVRNRFYGAVTGVIDPNRTITFASNLDLSGKDLSGKILYLVEGVGATLKRPWMKIASNTQTGTNDSITLVDYFPLALDFTTRFVVMGAEYWENISVGGVAPTKPVTDVCVIDSIAYVCQGAGANVLRLTYSAGAITGADEGYKADFMVMFVDTDGKKRAFRAVAATSLVYKAETGTTPLSWTQINNSKACGSSDSVITGLGVYDDPQRPWVFKEDEFGSISNNVYAPIPLGEMRTVRSRDNGVAWVQSGRFLFFSMGEGIQRYYQSALDDVGPDKDEGLPSERRGVIAHMVAYPGGNVFAAVDAGNAGYSQVLRFNGSGWCEVYRAPQGKRIRRLFIHNVDGLGYQMLWISQDMELVYIPIAKNPLTASGYQFNQDSSIVLAPMYTSYKDIAKFWNSVKAFVANTSSTIYVRGYYRVDDDSTWTQLPDDYDESPRKEVLITSDRSAGGVKIQLRLDLITDDAETPPYIEAVVVEGVTRIPVNFTWPITFVIADMPVDAAGDAVAQTALSMRNQLNAWADSRTRATPLLLTSVNELYDNRYVFVEAPEVRVITFEPEENGPARIRAVARCTLIGV